MAHIGQTFTTAALPKHPGKSKAAPAVAPTPAQAPESAFLGAIMAAGLTPPEHIKADGKLHRFSSNGKRGDLSGWYALHLDGVPAGSFGCWRTVPMQTWCSKADNDMTTAEKHAMRQRMQDAKAARDTEKAQDQAAAQADAQTRWDAASPAPASHPYLVAKGVQGHELRLEGDKLLVPIRDTAGTLHSLQTITQDGDKRFLPYGRKKGCFHTIGKFDPARPIVICEGFATGASIHEATGLCVVVAFDAGSLLPVAQGIRAACPPATKLILAADNDTTTEGNPGLTKATEAARTVAGVLALAVSSTTPGKKVDFNDLHQAEGLDAVARLIGSAAPAVADNAHSPLEQRNADDGVVLRCGADLTPMPIEWLWLHWLGIGKLHILAGAPGQGKTTIALSIGATVTIGGRWPDGSRCAVGNILIWSGEDDAADTLLPRLLAAGADKSRCYFIEATRRDGEVVPFDPARDLPQLQTAIEKIGGIKLLIVDPVVSAVTGDSHKNTEVRRALQPLVDMGAACGCAVLGITHFAKGGQGTDPAQRVVGSVAFTAVARVVLVAAKVKGKDGEDARILARGKSNIGPDDGGFEYHLEQAEPIPGIQASRIAWGKSVEGSARELLTDPDDGAEQSDDASVKNELPMLLWSELRDGPAPSKEVESALMGHGYSKKQIRNTREKMGVKPRKPNMAAAWFWELPPDFEPPTEWLDSVPFAEDAHEDAQDAQESKLGKLGNFGATSGKLGSRVTPKNRTPEQIRADGLEALRRAWETTGRQMDSEGGNFAFIPKAAIVQEFEREGLPEKATTNNLAQGQYISTRKEGWVMSQPKELARWGVAHPNAGDDDAIEVTF